MNRQLLIALFVIINSVSFSQEKADLEKYSISKYYTLEEAQNNIFKDINVNIIALFTQDINSAFSNIDDLGWLKEIAFNKKVVLIGETHYSRFITHLKSRIFFALNTYDYFPLIIEEKPYSMAEYINYFIHLNDDKEAKDFFNDELKPFVYTEEDSIFYEQMRNWNKINKEKPLRIGATDLEFKRSVTLNYILKPYFLSLKNTNKTKIDSIIDLGLSDEFFRKIRPLLQQAKKQNLTGCYSFITSSYIANVIANLESTAKAFKSDFDSNRHEAIKRNLTDGSFFGSYFSNGSKVMLYGGGNHMKTNVEINNSIKSYSEGQFLTDDYAPTKGKTYSIMINGMACFSSDKMSFKKLDKCIMQGSQYNQIVTRMQNACEENIIDKHTAYYYFNERNDFEKLIAAQSYLNKNSAIMFTDKSWQKLLSSAAAFHNEELNYVKSAYEHKILYNAYIFVPFSPIVTARIKK